MSKAYYAGIALMGLGAGLMYASGYYDAIIQQKREQRKVWADAGNPGTEVTGDVPDQRDGMDVNAGSR